MEGAKQMEYWLSGLFCFMQAFAMVLLFDAFFERKIYKVRFWAVFFLILIIIITYVNVVHTTISVLKMSGCVALYVVLNQSLYKGQLGMRLLVSLLGYAMIYLVEFFVDICLPAALSISYETFIYDRILYVLATVGDCLFLILLALLVRRFHRPRSQVKLAATMVVLLLPLATLVLLFPLYILFFSQPDAFVPLVIAVTVLICANAGVIILIDWLEQNTLLREQTLAASERLVAQQQSVEALSAAYAAQRKMTHDFQQHLSSLADLLPPEGAYDAARYLSELQAQQTERILTVNTHHAVVDALLNQKAQYAEKRGIDIRFEVNDLSALHISKTDCAVVIANLLDNAIEACMKLPHEQRWIEVKAVLEPAEPPEPGTLLLSVLNASLPVKIVNDYIDTTKDEPALHGFGILNVKEILSRYGAESVMLYRDNMFQFSIEWPNVPS